VSATIGVAVCLAAGSAGAAGTPAGFDITSQATVTFTVDADTFSTISNLATLKVVQLLDVTLTWQDASPVTVNPGDPARVLTFLVTNTGNGGDTFTLTGNPELGGDDFDPVPVALYLDADGNGVYDLGTDERYVAGENDPFLAADEALTVFALNKIPLATGEGELGLCQLRADGNIGTGPPGTVFPGAGEGGADAMVGTSGGTGSDRGSYVVSAVVVAVEKSATVLDLDGGAEPVPGALVTYTIIDSVAGSGTAREVIITDPIPPSTSYHADSLTLNSVPLTADADADAGDVGGTTPETVTVVLGDLTEASSGQTITFAVTID